MKGMLAGQKEKKTWSKVGSHRSFLGLTATRLTLVCHRQTNNFNPSRGGLVCLTATQALV